jgi:hypothetical protein
MSGIVSTADIDSPGDDVTGFSLDVTANLGFAGRARVYQALAGGTPVSAGGNTAAIDDLGAVGTTLKGAAAALHVVRKAGAAGTLTVKVQHSPDNSVWTDLITFGGKTAANLSEWLEVAGTVQRWLRVLWTLTGGTWDFHVAAARR